METLKIKGRQGTKFCPKCEAPNGARTHICKCGHEFVAKIKKGAIKEWQSIEPGTLVKIDKNGGTFYIAEDGTKLPMSYSGKAVVKSVLEDGLLVRFENEGTCFIYMGPDKYCEETGLHKRAKTIYATKQTFR